MAVKFQLLLCLVLREIFGATVGKVYKSMTNGKKNKPTLLFVQSVNMAPTQPLC